MSLSLIAFQPAMELPSNISPSVRLSSSITTEAMVRCCHLPLGSVKRRSTQSISSSFNRERILPASVAMSLPSLVARCHGPNKCGEPGGEPGNDDANRAWGLQIPEPGPRVRRAANISPVSGAGRDEPALRRTRLSLTLLRTQISAQIGEACDAFHVRLLCGRDRNPVYFAGVGSRRPTQDASDRHGE